MILQLPIHARSQSAAPALYKLPFSSGTIDPGNNLIATDPEQEDLVLVQWQRFGDPGIVDRIAATGASLVQPLAPVSYLVWADAAQTRALRGVPGIRWAGVLPAGIRVSNTVSSSTSRLRITTIGNFIPAGLQIHRIWPRAFTDAGGHVLEVAGTIADAQLLAQIPFVYSIAEADGRPQLRDERSAQIIAGNLSAKGRPKPGYPRFLKSIGATGRGVVIGHVDGGVDFNHPDLDDRVKACIDYTYASGTNCAIGNHDDAIGHGTHTGGIIVGTGDSGFSDQDDFHYGIGVAPGAKLVVQNAITLNPAPDPFADGYRPIYFDSYKKGAIVSANSWGPSGSPQGYDEDTREFDTIPRDIDLKKNGDQPQAFVLSIMNGSGGKSTQGTPDEGKNLIRVGGSGNRPSTAGAAPGANDLCTCSAHGPALDGRMLPDVVAPGQNVISSRATQGTLCGIPALAAEFPPSPLHAACTGTSMASPHVSGGYAVFVEWYRKHIGGTPSPALVKGAFINGAVDLSRFGGVDADDAKLKPIPNNQQGWGRFDLGNTMRAWMGPAVHIDQDVVFTDSSQSHNLRVRAADPSEPLKVTLVWTDAPGHGKGGKLPAWVNDLDLVVSGGGGRWLGNVFKGGWSVPGGKADRMNNVENVYLRSPGRGTYAIRIDAANIIGNALPSLAGPTDQDFALIITNARRV
jgi:serine protease AprX